MHSDPLPVSTARGYLSHFALILAQPLITCRHIRHSMWSGALSRHVRVGVITFSSHGLSSDSRTARNIYKQLWR